MSDDKGFPVDPRDCDCLPTDPLCPKCGASDDAPAPGWTPEKLEAMLAELSPEARYLYQVMCDMRRAHQLAESRLLASRRAVEGDD